MQGNVGEEQNTVLTRSGHAHLRQLAAVGRSVAEAWQQEHWHKVFRIIHQMKQGRFPYSEFKSPGEEAWMAGI